MDEPEVKCPYCNSKDLSKLPVPTGSPPSQTTTYKCQMCGRTFSKTSKTPEVQ